MPERRQLGHLGTRWFGRRSRRDSPRPEPQTWAGRARDAYETMVREFGVADTPLFREHAPALPTDRRYAYLWPFGQAFAATLDIAVLGDKDAAALARAETLADAFFAHYWDTASRPPGGTAYPIPPGGDKYYDDNIWLGLDLIDLWRATGEGRWRDNAARIFAFVSSAWDDDPRHPSPGGIFWAQPAANPTRDRNTVSNAPAAILALHLHEATGKPTYLDWAERTFAWVERTLRDPSDGLYWDHLKLDGRIERTKWSYNQGTMIGAATLLSRATGDDVFLDRARLIADAALAYYAADERLRAQDPPFNAIFFRNLRLLGDALGDHSSYRPLLTAYAARAWREGRDPRTGLIGFGRRGRVELLHQAAATQLFSLLAGIDEGGL
ncbi:MAG: GH76 [uncultured Thermomicrobiales bacterium]|uniref:GH76 n=1 Tax=uncultured Thermomicrobiales bacterium TaxID=1645740 RepID=A0A6J4UVW2_9BACT|nr:MAG: GH76 [uncultured Thermomicrobiales bacterium]